MYWKHGKGNRIIAVEKDYDWNFDKEKIPRRYLVTKDGTNKKKHCDVIIKFFSFSNKIRIHYCVIVWKIK